ncbi:hypothetical protein XENTR_v10005459 [Xenopus tropicalis]|uniref:G protein-coupled receptor 82 n=1 Tax=Xenopus tropicalis TaxID=8364 RepID=A0A6I8QCZ9_XENTR|nr:probable G-protein coupled receptor 82 [Xenopus tropicalis]KAE8623014.1 hypothetical protein XENTR_v10005459 [Xenopus tropicalis]KAE8623015.1 hypothetical protein XENTR_v10005459 [Xenopus tropicalis]|eukprot:XP_004911832.1 PREDICTED: probable G-protein coupled receptor 82 [Xenopus tropicalis]
MWNNSSCLYPRTFSTIGLPIIYSIMFVLSVFGNLVCLWIFTKFTSKKTSTHIYLINLTISNILVSAGMPFQAAYYLKVQYMPYSSTECRFLTQFGNLLTHSSMCVSIILLCWIAISRYAILVKHDEMTQSVKQTPYEKILFGKFLKSFRNPKFARYLCIGIWIAVACPNVYLVTVTTDHASNKLCFNEEVEIGKSHVVISSRVELAFFFLFALTVILFYCFFINYIKTLQANSCIDGKFLIYRKVKRNIVAIMALLLICFAPYHLSKLFIYGLVTVKDCQLLNISLEIKNICLCLAEFRSCCDPIMYFCLDDNFKRNFQTLFKKKPDGSSTQLQATNITPV